MSLAAPVWVHLIWPLLLVLVLMRFSEERRREALRLLLQERWQSLVGQAGLARQRRLRDALWAAGLALVVLAATQPRWGFTWRQIEVRGLDVVIALDLSRSMDAQDLSPSRLERARREVNDLLTGMSNDRVGLVIFAAGAYPRVPLTLDHEMLYEILEDTGTNVLQAQGSSVAAALRTGQDLFGEEAADRAIVLISDGETWDEDLAAATRQLAEAGIRVYAIGVGTTEGAPIPEEGGGFKQHNGEVVLSRLDEGALRSVAAATGGAYVRSSAGADDTDGILRELRASLTRTQGAVQREKVYDERFQWALAAGLGLLVISALIREGRPIAALGLLFALSLPARAVDDPLRQPSAAAVERPNDPQAQWALAEALYRAGRYDEAARVFDDIAARAPGDGLRENALYNSGISRYRAGRLDEAVRSWDELLQDNPDHEGAKKNREAVAKEIAARMQPPQPSPDPQGSEGSQPPQPGEPSDAGAGEPQPAPSEGEPSGGEPGEPQPGDGTRTDKAPEQSELPPDAEGAGDPNAEAPPAEDSGQEPGEAAQPAPRGMSAEEARRLLEGAEEGRPRVVIRGKPEERDW